MREMLSDAALRGKNPIVDARRQTLRTVGLVFNNPTETEPLSVTRRVVLRSGSGFCPRMGRSSSLPLGEARSDPRRLRTTSRVVANSSPRRKQERRVLHEGASFALYAGISRGWARAGGRGESRSLHRRVARTPPLADRMGRKSLRVSPREGAGLRLRRARWSGHYPRGRERWGGADRLRTVTRG